MEAVIAALLYVAGALLVLAAAFMPLSARVYGRPPAQQVAAVRAAPLAWRWHHVLFASGATVTAAASVWEAIGWGRTAAVAAATAFVLGAALFVHFLRDRLMMPPTAWFGSATGRRRFAVFTLLTALAIVLRGLAAAQEGEDWGMWLAGYGGLLLALYLILRDMPPFAHYVGTLGLGIALLP